MRGYRLLRQHRIPCDILCVVHAENVQHPTEVYRFFKEIKAPYIGFLPLVEPQPDGEGGVSRRTVPAEASGQFSLHHLRRVEEPGYRAGQSADIRGGGQDRFRAGACALYLSEDLRRYSRGRTQRRLLFVRPLRRHGTSAGEYPGDSAGRSSGKSGAEGVRAGQMGYLTPLLAGRARFWTCATAGVRRIASCIRRMAKPG